MTKLLMTLLGIYGFYLIYKSLQGLSKEEELFRRAMIARYGMGGKGEDNECQTLH